MLHGRGSDHASDGLPDKCSTADGQRKLQRTVNVDAFFHRFSTPLKITRGSNSCPGLRCHYVVTVEMETICQSQLRSSSRLDQALRELKPKESQS